VLANSERTRADAVRLLGADAARVRVVYYGADAEVHRPPADEERAAARAALGWTDDAPVVAFVGALGDRRKGFDTVLAAWERLAAEAGWDAVLAVVGAGGEAAAWRRRAAAAGLDASVRFLGFRDDVRTVLWASDAVVAPSRYEAYGLAVQEALCCGLPALVSADAGVAERIDGPLRGLLLPDPESAAGLAERLRSWHGARVRLGAEARALSASLRARSWAAMGAEVVEALE
jgi:glycosyltransferase involved in cell wall biosynthesis